MDVLINVSKVKDWAIKKCWHTWKVSVVSRKYNVQTNAKWTFKGKMQWIIIRIAKMWRWCANIALNLTQDPRIMILHAQLVRNIYSKLTSKSLSLKKKHIRTIWNSIIESNHHKSSATYSLPRTYLSAGGGTFTYANSCVWSL